RAARAIIVTESCQFSGRIDAEPPKCVVEGAIDWSERVMTGTDLMREVPVPAPFSLAATCGPVDWARGRWPNEDWIGGELIWVGWEGDRVVHRRVRSSGESLSIGGDADPELDRIWASSKLCIDHCMPRP